MKKLFTLTVFVFAFMMGMSQGGAKIEFERTTVDYGVIEQHSDPYRVFKYKNTGGAPLIISHAKGSCGCTVPEYSKEPLAPGQEGEIKVRYATNRIGLFTKTVTLTTNSTPSVVVLTIKGKVLAPAPKPVEETTPATSH
ncbi:MAG: DUF1573 domain-containing protein [Cytophagales bacterium]|nr:DUF1573 domain-containing protein [Cytophagales bacterium]